MKRGGRYGAVLALSVSASALGCSESSDGPRASAGDAGASGSGGAAQGGGSGGAAEGGTGNGATGGSSASGGSSAAGSGGGGPAPSSGCDASSWPEPGTFSIDVGGIAREYILALPESYDPATPYRLVFAWHGRTGTAEQVASGFGGGFYGLSSAERGGDSTIFVAGQGLGTDEDPADTGWPNTDGQDIDFVVAMLDWLRESYCIDESRIFSVGMSYGGIMSHTIGCELGDVFRGIAPIAGAIFGGGSQPGCVCRPGCGMDDPWQRRHGTHYRQRRARSRALARTERL